VLPHPGASLHRVSDAGGPADSSESSGSPGICLRFASMFDMNAASTLRLWGKPGVHFVSKTSRFLHKRGAHFGSPILLLDCTAVKGGDLGKNGAFVQHSYVFNIINVYCPLEQRSNRLNYSPGRES